jgi:hypothetical protein
MYECTELYLPCEYKNNIWIDTGIYTTCLNAPTSTTCIRWELQVPNMQVVRPLLIWNQAIIPQFRDYCWEGENTWHWMQEGLRKFQQMVHWSLNDTGWALQKVPVQDCCCNYAASSRRALWQVRHSKPAAASLRRESGGEFTVMNITVYLFEAF